MAQLDSSIPLMVRGPQLENPQNMLAQSLRLKSAQFGLDQQQQAAGERNALAEALRQPGAFDASGNLSRSAIPGIAAASPTQVPAYSQLINQQDQSAAKVEQQKMESARQHVQLQAQLLGTVTDAASYERAKQQYVQYGGDASQLPPAYDANWVAQAKQGAMTAAQQFDQHYKEQMLALAERRQSFNEQNPALTPLDTANGPVLINQRTATAQPITMGGQSLPGKQVTLNDTQAKANLFATRMDAADGILNDMAKQGTEMPSVLKSVAESVPLVGGALGAGVNAFIASPQEQKVEQAQRDFVNAVLRRESGAAISPTEFDSAKKQYFPALGDGPEVIAQKAANRRTAIQGMQAEVPANFSGQRPSKPAAPAGAPGDYSHLWGG